ncbi:MAG: hypothetical protein L0Y79_01285 [Chlorobi bacterium]|nr:hypothetical protein [Chlorobiota bacterium]MCI0717253.1 hypothetical protein [Chlorobiota bacterium]
MPLIKVFGTSRILNEGVKLAGEESEKLCHHIILSARNKVGNFLEIKDGSVSEKSECKIIVKIWNELYKSYPGLEFGDYYFESDNFHGIISVNSGLNTDPRKAVQKAVGELKSRTTLLLNRYHNIYGSVFWENGYREIAFKDNGKLGNLMDYFWKHPA